MQRVIQTLGFSLLTASIFSLQVEPPQTSTFPVRLPQAKPTEPETYLCHPVRLEKKKTYHIIGFEPKADMGTAHHMLLFGCKSPGAEEPIFSCGEMGRVLAGTKQASPCRSGQKIIYAWARNAPRLDLPPDVGFKVGGEETDIDYLVLQVHYASVDRIPASGDESGVLLTYTDVAMPKLAGVYFMATNGMIPAKTTTYMETACKLKQNVDIHPFAFRTHTHALGRVVSGWKVSPDMEWSLLGKKDPQLPQMFYPVNDTSMVIRKGDTLAARCTMVSYRDRVTWVGATGEDEMCNFYLMYWVDGDKLLRNDRCISVGPPIYSWGRPGFLGVMGSGLTNIPDKEASSLYDNYFS